MYLYFVFFRAMCFPPISWDFSSICVSSNFTVFETGRVSAFAHQRHTSVSVFAPEAHRMCFAHQRHSVPGRPHVRQRWWHARSAVETHQQPLLLRALARPCLQLSISSLGSASRCLGLRLCALCGRLVESAWSSEQVWWSLVRKHQLTWACRWLHWVHHHSDKHVFLKRSLDHSP